MDGVTDNVSTLTMALTGSRQLLWIQFEVPREPLALVRLEAQVYDEGHACEHQAGGGSNHEAKEIGVSPRL